MVQPNTNMVFCGGILDAITAIEKSKELNSVGLKAIIDRLILTDKNTSQLDASSEKIYDAVCEIYKGINKESNMFGVVSQLRTVLTNYNIPQTQYSL